ELRRTKSAADDEGLFIDYAFILLLYRYVIHSNNPLEMLRIFYEFDKKLGLNYSKSRDIYVKYLCQLLNKNTHQLLPEDLIIFKTKLFECKEKIANVKSEDEYYECRKYYSETYQIIEDLMNVTPEGKGKMKVVRVNSVKKGEELVKILTYIRKMCKYQEIFEVIGDMGNTDLFKVSEPFKTKFELNKLTDRYGDPRDPLYEDLEDLPCILVLCEKGRMGDTFPFSFNCMDLRIRYTTKSIPLLTCFIQEMGRMCRYSADEK